MAGEAKVREVKVREVTLGDGVPKICIPVTPGSFEELRAQVKQALAGPCDLVEWRADFFRELQEGWLPKALRKLREELREKPLLFTFRTKEEGGARSVSLQEYERLNLAVADTGLADLIDVELNRGEDVLRSLAAQLQARGVRVVASFHDFEKTPTCDQITQILRRMQDCGADITKAAVMPQTEQDVLTLLEASLQMKQQFADRPYITMSMGRLGSISRLAGALTGAAVTFALSGRASAPGQLEAELAHRLLAALQS